MLSRDKFSITYDIINGIQLFNYDVSHRYNDVEYYFSIQRFFNLFKSSENLSLLFEILYRKLKKPKQLVQRTYSIVKSLPVRFYVVIALDMETLNRYQCASNLTTEPLLFRFNHSNVTHIVNHSVTESLSMHFVTNSAFQVIVRYESKVHLLQGYVRFVHLFKIPIHYSDATPVV